MQLGLPPRVAPPATDDLRLIEPTGRLLTPADVGPACRTLLAPPFDQPVIVDLGAVDELLSSAARVLCDHISWRVYWSPVVVVAPDPEILQHFRCRFFDTIASIHTCRATAVRALTERSVDDPQSAATSRGSSPSSVAGAPKTMTDSR